MHLRSFDLYFITLKVNGEKKSVCVSKVLWWLPNSWRLRKRPLDSSEWKILQTIVWNSTDCCVFGRCFWQSWFEPGFHFRILWWPGVPEVKLERFWSFHSSVSYSQTLGLLKLLIVKKVCTIIHGKGPKESPKKGPQKFTPKEEFPWTFLSMRIHQKFPQEFTHFVHKNSPFMSTRILPPFEMGFT